MTSQLNVDTIVDKAGSGGTNVKVGNTSTYVSDGGNVTQNIAQALAAAWCCVDHDSTTTFYDSFNFASVTDNGTGDYTVTFTNAMSGTRYSPVTGCYSADGDITNAANEATTSHKIRVFDDTGSAKDVDCFSTTHGDLA